MAKQNDKSTAGPKVLSLFSGIGGLDLGFQAAGFDIVGMVEWNHDACETMRLNFGPKANIVEADINDVTPEALCIDEVDFFIGGPPCQTFSAIGRRAGGAPGRLDDRGDLFTQYCRLLKHYRPKGFLFENVRGILSSNKGQDWVAIRTAFESLGYHLSYRVMDAAGFGVAQHRERVILVGLLDGKSFLFPRPIFGPDSRDGKDYVSAGEALEKVNHDEEINLLYNKGGKYDHLLEEVPPGSNYLHFTSEMGHPHPKFAWRSKFSDFLHKASPTSPVKTIVASMGRYSGPFHWDSRKMSIGELKRLQGFPDDFKLAGGRTSKVRQIGNSVVPVFSEYLALAVSQQVFNSDVAVELIDQTFALSFDSRKGSKAGNTRKKRLAFNNDISNMLPIEIEQPILSRSNIPELTFELEFEVPVFKSMNQSVAQGYKIHELVVDGHAKLSALGSAQGNNQNTGRVELEFNSDVVPGIKYLQVQVENYDSQHLSVLWDLTHNFVSRHSSYPSLHELYGHFTEPRPKFRITNFEMVSGNTRYSQLLSWMAQNQVSDHMWSITKLDEFGFNVSNERELAESIRCYRIDYRSNLTNARIPQNHFRICYPYTMPSDRKSFIKVA